MNPTNLLHKARRNLFPKNLNAAFLFSMFLSDTLVYRVTDAVPPFCQHAKHTRLSWQEVTGPPFLLYGALILLANSAA